MRPGLLLALLLSACVPGVEEMNRPCPCDEWTCCRSDAPSPDAPTCTCIPPGDVCLGQTVTATTSC